MKLFLTTGRLANIWIFFPTEKLWISYSLMYEPNRTFHISDSRNYKFVLINKSSLLLYLINLPRKHLVAVLYIP